MKITILVNNFANNANFKDIIVSNQSRHWVSSLCEVSDSDTFAF